MELAQFCEELTPYYWPSDRTHEFTRRLIELLDKGASLNLDLHGAHKGTRNRHHPLACFVYYAENFDAFIGREIDMDQYVSDTSNQSLGDWLTSQGGLGRKAAAAFGVV